MGTYLQLCYYFDKLNKRKPPKEKLYRHHVQPKSQGGTDAETNIVLLTFKQHMFVHRKRYYEKHNINDLLAFKISQRKKKQPKRNNIFS